MCEIAVDGPSRSQSKSFELILWVPRAAHASVFVFVHVRLLNVLCAVDCGVRLLVLDSCDAHQEERTRFCKSA